MKGIRKPYLRYFAALRTFYISWENLYIWTSSWNILSYYANWENQCTVTISECEDQQT